MPSPDVDRSEVLRRHLVDAACAVLDHEHLTTQTVMEPLPGGPRLMIHVEILPPDSDPESTLLRVLPSEADATR